MINNNVLSQYTFSAYTVTLNYENKFLQVKQKYINKNKFIEKLKAVTGKY